MPDIELTLDFKWTASELRLQQRRFSHPDLQQVLCGFVNGPGVNIGWNEGVRNLCAAFVRVKRRLLQSGGTEVFDGDIGKRMFESFKPSKAVSTSWIRDFFGVCYERKKSRLLKRRKQKCRTAMKSPRLGYCGRNFEFDMTEEVEVSLLSKIICAKRGQILISANCLPYEKLTIKVGGVGVSDFEGLRLLEEALGHKSLSENSSGS